MSLTVNGDYVSIGDVEQWLTDGADGCSAEEAREILGGNWRKLYIGDDVNRVCVERW